MNKDEIVIYENNDIKVTKFEKENKKGKQTNYYIFDKNNINNIQMIIIKK